jgi:hypothetical protein
VFRRIKRAHVEAQRTYYALCARNVPRWGLTYKTTRLCCPDCDGYLIYGKKGAFCSERCGFTLRRPDYLNEKCRVVFGILVAGPPPFGASWNDPWPHFRIEHRGRKKIDAQPTGP